MTERQMIERHSIDEACIKCHARIDPFGFSLENFDAIGRHRVRDSHDLPIDAKTKLPDGHQIDGLDGLRGYLLTTRRQDFLKQFNRKLLGYALGRSVQLSDEPLLAELLAAQEGNEYRLQKTIELIVTSKQFSEIRGRDVAVDE